MNPKALATILLVISVLDVESCGHGGEHRVRGGGGHLHEATEASAQRRMVHQKGDHLFNNIAKGFSNMIRDAFTKTRLKICCNAITSGNSLIITEKLSGKDEDVTKEFPAMVGDFQKYKTDQALTTDRDKLTVFGQKHYGADKNADEWDKTLGALKMMTFEFIDKFIETYSSKGTEKYENFNRLDNIRNRIDQAINNKEYVDQDAMKNFPNSELVNKVEQRTKEAMRNLPMKINTWALEAAKFYKKKTGSR